MRFHPAEKTFPCDACVKAFENSSNLDYHKRIPTGETFKFDSCEKAFSKSDKLIKHKMLHTLYQVRINSEYSLSYTFCYKQFC